MSSKQHRSGRESRQFRPKTADGRAGTCKRILFVCTGNTCRSPMAAALFNHLGNDAGCQAESAGVAAFPGQPASAPAVEVMQAVYGIDLSGHRARNITRSLAEAFDLVLTMTEEHRQVLQQAMPELGGKLQTLARAAGQDGPDVLDPYGCQAEQYAQTAAQLDALLRLLLARCCGKDACSQKTDG